MSPSRLFILRPVATGLFMASIVLAGLLGLRFLPLAALPEVDYPTIQVQTLYPGGSPDVMSRTVTAPLERQFGQMSGLQRMSSISAAGVSIITLQFALAQSLGAAEQQVQAAINAGGSLLPADLPAPPVYAKVNPADAPIMSLAVRSDSMPLTEVQNLVDTRVAQRISQIGGVGLVSLAGGQRPAVRIQGNLEALASLGLGLDSVRAAISAANTSGAKGGFDGPTRSWSINSNDQLTTQAEFENLVIAWRSGAPVRLRDVAQVVQGPEDRRLAAWVGFRGAGASADASSAHGATAETSADDGLQPAIVLDIRRQPGANVIATADAIRKALPELRASLPETLQLDVLADRTNGIRASVSHVQAELVMAVVMVVLVIFLFLHSVRATIIASVAVPISLVGAAGVMYLLGYSLNNLSLMALTIATGFVVDDAIVMIENISRHRENGKPPFQAAMEGAEEIGFTIISLTVSLIAVLIPLLFMQEVIGRLFREFAVTLAVTILVSAVVSLTLVPMLSARWLAPLEEGAGRIGRAVQRALDSVIHHYDRALGVVLAHRGITLLVAFATVLATAALYWVMPKGLFPTQSTGQLQVRVQADAGVSFERMSELQRQVATVMLHDPAVDTLAAVVGVDAANNSRMSSGRLVVNVRRQGMFGDSQATVMQRLHDAVVAQVPGVTLYLQPTQDLTIDSESGPTEYRFALEGVQTDVVDDWAQRMVERLRTLPTVRNPTTDAGLTGRAALVDLNRDTAARLGVTASALDDALYNAFGQRIVSTIFTETNQYRVILEAARETPGSMQVLSNLPLRTAGGGTTPLSTVATVAEVNAPLQVMRVAQYPAATVGFDTAPDVSLGATVESIRAAATEIGLPASITLRFTGAAGAYERALSNQVGLLLAAIVCVYIVLGVLYESYVHPLTILSTLPSAGIGALFALWISGHPLDIVGVIGLVLLIGIVKKNAIIMIDFAIDAERLRGRAPVAAIREAALLRFRPILMTTLAALAAALPLMLSWGEGAELRRPLGIAIFGGLVFSQLMTLFTTPVVYLAFDALARRLSRDRTGPPASAAP